MEQKEMELLQLIEKNGRLEVEDLAKMLDLSVDATKQMIVKLETEGAILGYATVINWSKVLKYEGVTAMIDVKVTPTRGVGFDKVAERIYRFPEVKAVYLMSGAYDLSVSVEGKTMMEISRFVSEKLSALDTVISTTTHFVLKKYKHDGVIFDDQDDDDKRIMVSP
ncbi:Lrp/AsnC family transcriptional regulator [Aquibacillus koreensis]|uniref:Lrp/AsnC family transcriptional regulator n=1 Tax=Aquibacillus koreensis TaxID=279446 RepID=A0A9X4AIY1_9BACI|nr:Lrp/AsnC family transcriptional regulator [Aquibacillus koreensis]MCT2537773.1 Lrp/AsnC family transcriptional regulator [Aquibacillus koreensis]MDC3421194.1 Lrp/AsnC family transcriptional regulator [Aquibacillus koreensis]